MTDPRKQGIGASEAASFDAESHVYRLGHRIVPSVTQVLSAVFPCDAPAGAMEAARERGNLVHEATEHYDRGRLDVDAVRDDVVPYVLAWIAFRRDTDIEILAIEEPMIHHARGYAGTPDRLARWRRKTAVCDIKATARIEPTTALQTAAYAELAATARHLKIEQRFTVQLRPDATYRVQEWAEPTDLGVFLCALQIHQWKARHQ